MIKEISSKLFKNKRSAISLIMNQEFSDELLSEEFGDDKLNDPIEFCNGKLRRSPIMQVNVLEEQAVIPESFSNELPTKLIEDSKSFES